MTQYKIAAFYKFVTIDDRAALKQALLDHCRRHGIKGTILLAEEGINGTISGRPDSLDAVLDLMRQDERFSDLEFKFSYAGTLPFYRMKVSLKKEIISFGQPIDPVHQTGAHIEPEQWNKLISDPDVLVLDTRNDYEVEVGTFARAEDPKLDAFTEFADYVDQHLHPQKHKKVAMFCTGGIRCEKASAYMLQQGFEQVYQLKGGILKYLEEVPTDQSLWQGECFVFDQRVTVDHQLKRGQYELCYSCQHPLSEADLASDQFKQGVHCPYCVDQLSEEKRIRNEERQKQVELAEQRGKPHIGRFDPRDQGEA